MDVYILDLLQALCSVKIQDLRKMHFLLCVCVCVCVCVCWCV